MHNHTSSLFHYTKQREYLIGILKHGLYPNYCKEQYLGVRNDDIIGIPMVSFCDIPIMRVQDFSSDYGKFAIAFSKEWALKKAINPVFYLQERGLKKTLSFFRTVENYFSDLHFASDDNKLEVTNVLDQHQLDNLANLIRSAQTQYANDTLLGYIKPYKFVDKGKEHVNYVENEWRYIVKEINGVTWKKGEEAYSKWRGKQKEKPKAPKEVLAQKLTFSIDDITYLITKTEKDSIKLMQDIQDLNVICDLPITEFDKFKLVNKIISFEKIENDF